MTGATALVRAAAVTAATALVGVPAVTAAPDVLRPSEDTVSDSPPS